jgi:hypothetical protein
MAVGGTSTKLSPEARALLDAMGSSDGPEPGRRDRVRRALAAGLATATVGKAVSAGAAAAGAGAKVGQAIAVVKAIASVNSIVLCALAGATAAALALTPAYLRAAREKAAAATMGAAATVEATKGGALRTPDQPHAPETDTEAASGLPSPLSSGPSSPVASAPPAPVSVPSRGAASARARSNLADEMQLLERAQEALRAGHPRDALAWLDRYHERFRVGVLSDEERILRVLSLCGLGRHEEAARQARALLAEAPSSPLLPRLRASCAFEGPERDSGRDDP